MDALYLYRYKIKIKSMWEKTISESSYSSYWNFKNNRVTGNQEVKNRAKEMCQCTSLLVCIGTNIILYLKLMDQEIELSIILMFNQFFEYLLCAGTVLNDADLTTNKAYEIRSPLYFIFK